VKALALATLLAAARPAHADDRAHAQPVPQKAKDLAERGRALHDAGDYADAIAAFNKAYVLAPTPGLLFNLAQAYRLAGQCDDAAWMYRRFLDSNPPPAQRALAENHLATVEKCGHGGLRISIVPPVLEAAPPAPEAPRVDPPSAAPVAVVTSSESPHGRRAQRIGIGLGIGGGVFLASAVYFAIDAQNAASTVSAAYKNGGDWSQISDANARGERSATMADVLGIAGGVAVATGAVMYAIGRHAEYAQHVAVVPTNRGGGVRLSWGF
jgi:tetratricopeptide (TPR) repeat protein